VKLTVLGSASGQADAKRNFSAYLVESSAGFYLLDADEGTARQLVRIGLNPEKIDAVFVSHMHPDHASGVFGLLQWMHLCGRKKSLPLHLPPGVIPQFDRIFPVFLIEHGKWAFEFGCVALPVKRPFHRGRFALRAVPNAHAGPGLSYADQVKQGRDSYSFILEDSGRTMVYTSDVPNLRHLDPWAGGADVLVSECTHVPQEDIFAFASEHGIARTVLSHIPFPDNPPSQPLSGPPFMWASDGDALEV